MELILNDAKDRNTNYSPSTLSTFETYLTTLNDGKPFKNCNFLLDTNKIINKIDNLRNKRDNNKFLANQTKKFYYTAACALLRTSKGNGDVLQEYGKKINEYKKQYNTDRDKETTTDLDNYESSENLKKLVLQPLREKFNKIIENKQIMVRDCEQAQYYVLAACYLLQAPLRCDWATLRVITENDEDTLDHKHNYLLLDAFTGMPRQIILNNYKTSNSYGKFVRSLETPLQQILFRFINSKHFLYMNNAHTDDDFHYLFHGYSRRAGEFVPMTPNALSKVIPHIFKNDKQPKRITVNLLRKIWATEHTDKELYEKLKDNSMMMCHSVNTHMNTYHKG